MKWAKYFGFLLLSFCLFFGLSPLKQVKAVTYNASFIIQRNYAGRIVYVQVAFPRNAILGNATNYYTYDLNFDNGILHIKAPFYATDFYDNLNDAINSTSLFYISDSRSWGYETVIFNYGSFSTVGSLNNFYPSIEDYEDSLVPSWWDNVKQAFMDFVGSDALSDVLSGNWLEYIEDVLFGELWTVKVGEGEDDMIIPETVSPTPTPSPTPLPTPIPFSTVINPSTGEVTYNYFIDVSGTPIPTSSIYPPVTSYPGGGGGGGSPASFPEEPYYVEDYYEPDDSLSIPKLRIFKFLLRMPGNETDIGLDSLDNNIAVMDETLEDNAEAIQGVGDLFQIIPVKWFLLIGTLACFPVIAAMIKSLLGG